MNPTAVTFPPDLTPLIMQLLGYAFWVGMITFTIGLGWAAVRFFGANDDDAPGLQDHRRNYVAIVLIAGILMSSAAGIGSVLVDNTPTYEPTPFRGSTTNTDPDQGKF